MKRNRFIAIIVLALTWSGQAEACFVKGKLSYGDVRRAELVVVGKIANYKIVQDERFPQRGVTYARFDVQVEEVLAGSAQKSVSVVWGNSTFGQPDTLPEGSYLIALVPADSMSSLLRVPGTPLGPISEPGLMTVLQEPCAPAFLFESSGKEAKFTRLALKIPF